MKKTKSKSAAPSSAICPPVSYTHLTLPTIFAPVGIVFINNEGVIRECNRQAEAFLRQADGIELINANLMDFIKKSDRHGLGIELDNIRSGVKKSASMELALIKGPKVALSYGLPTLFKLKTTPTAPPVWCANCWHFPASSRCSPN